MCAVSEPDELLSLLPAAAPAMAAAAAMVPEPSAGSPTAGTRPTLSVCKYHKQPSTGVCHTIKLLILMAMNIWMHDPDMNTTLKAVDYDQLSKLELWLLLAK